MVNLIQRTEFFIQQSFDILKDHFKNRKIEAIIDAFLLATAIAVSVLLLRRKITLIKATVICAIAIGIINRMAAIYYKSIPDALAAVQKNGYALPYAGEDMKNNEAVVLAAVRQNGVAFRYADPNLQELNNSDFAIELFSIDPKLLRLYQNQSEENWIHVMNALGAILNVEKKQPVQTILQNMDIEEDLKQILIDRLLYPKADQIKNARK